MIFIYSVLLLLFRRIVVYSSIFVSVNADTKKKQLYILLWVNTYFFNKISKSTSFVLLFVLTHTTSQTTYPLIHHVHIQTRMHTHRHVHIQTRIHTHTTNTYTRTHTGMYTHKQICNIIYIFITLLYWSKNYILWSHCCSRRRFVKMNVLQEFYWLSMNST